MEDECKAAIKTAAAVATRPGGGPLPLVAAVEMGYGHLRAAHVLAAALGTEVVRVDRPPFAGAGETRLWDLVRRAYESLSRGAAHPALGPPLTRLIDAITAIDGAPPGRDASAPTAAAHALAGLLEAGVGGGLVRELRRTGRPLVATYFLPALAAARAGLDPVWCLVTDSDLSRAWVPVDPRARVIRYLAPTDRAAARLVAYGVPPERVHRMGFPLPASLEETGNGQRPSALAARLVRLDPAGTFLDAHGGEVERALGPLPAGERGQAPRLTVAVGGAGAQTRLAVRLLGGLRDLVATGKLRLTLVAGVRSEVATEFRAALSAAGLDKSPGVNVVEAAGAGEYFARFERTLAGTDLMWTKPSELAFYAALGIPLLLAPPIGVHERANREWLLGHGAAIDAHDIAGAGAGAWLETALVRGHLAAAAWAGFQQLERAGTRRIVEAVTRG